MTAREVAETMHEKPDPDFPRLFFCPHDCMLVEDNGALYTCQKCGASLKYVLERGHDFWPPDAKKMWRDWIGPNWNKKRVIDWELTWSRRTSSINHEGNDMSIDRTRPPNAEAHFSWGAFVAWVVIPVAVYAGVVKVADSLSRPAPAIVEQVSE